MTAQQLIERLQALPEELRQAEVVTEAEDDGYYWPVQDEFEVKKLKREGKYLSSWGDNLDVIALVIG
jgi:hypothetical protein